MQNKDKNKLKEEQYAKKAEAYAENIQSEMPKMSKLSIIWNSLYLILYLVFIGYNLLAAKGNTIMNFILLGFTLLYAVFYYTTVALGNGNKKTTKKAMKPAKRVYKLVKRVFKLVNVLIMVTLLIQTKGYYENNKFAVIMAFITTPMVILQLSIDISRFILTYQIKRLRKYYDNKLTNLYNEFKNANADDKKQLIKEVASELNIEEKEISDKSNKIVVLKKLAKNVKGSILSFLGEKNNAKEVENEDDIILDSEEIIINNIEEDEEREEGM